LVSPNHHALAAQFVLLDNYYCNGVCSADGHSWATEGNASDYNQKSFGVWARGYPGGDDPLVYSSTGFIWNNVLSHGLTFRNFGELALASPQPPGITWLQVYAHYTNHAGPISFNHYVNISSLAPYTSSKAPGWDQRIPDVVRAQAFLREFNGAQGTGYWQDFTILFLPQDHGAANMPGFPTPTAMMADNDLALGQVVEAVSKSIFWSNTVIFVNEDDSLIGADHVDGHRSICLVISPYTRRGQTISTFYNQAGVIHTMEQILGLPPMNQMDAMSPLMADCFTNVPNFTPTRALTNNIPLDTMNPDPANSLTCQEYYYAEQSLKLDFSGPDRADLDMLNRITWRSIKGDVPYPAQLAGPHGKGLAGLGLMLDQSKADDDDDDDD
jgi:hypothetical protein